LKVPMVAMSFLLGFDKVGQVIQRGGVEWVNVVGHHAVSPSTAAR
jgi:hypothetical protein